MQLSFCGLDWNRFQVHSELIPIPGPPILGQFRVQSRTESNSGLSPSPDSGITALNCIL